MTSSIIQILKYNNIKTLILEIESPFSVEDMINLQYNDLIYNNLLNWWISVQQHCCRDCGKTIYKKTEFDRKN